MPKNHTRRRVVFYDRQSIQIDIRVFQYDTLTTREMKKLADFLADQAMLSIRDAPFIDAALSRIKTERPRS